MSAQGIVCFLIDWLMKNQQGIGRRTPRSSEEHTRIPLHDAKQKKKRDSKCRSRKMEGKRDLICKRDLRDCLRPPNLFRLLHPASFPLATFAIRSTFTMFRPAARALAHAPTVASRTPATRRLISTGPPKPRSWKNTILRLGLAGGAIYYYNTSSVFSEEPKCMSSYSPGPSMSRLAFATGPIPSCQWMSRLRIIANLILPWSSLSSFFDPQTKWRRCQHPDSRFYHPQDSARTRR